METAIRKYGDCCLPISRVWERITCSPNNGRQWKGLRSIFFYSSLLRTLFFQLCSVPLGTEKSLTAPSASIKSIFLILFRTVHQFTSFETKKVSVFTIRFIKIIASASKLTVIFNAISKGK